MNYKIAIVGIFIVILMATPTIKFNQFGTLPSGYTAVLNISGTYEVA